MINKQVAHTTVILIVEDDGEVRRLLVSFFRDMGCTVLEAVTGEQAVAYLDRASSIDVVMTDLHLGGDLNGWDVGEAYATVRPDLFVIYGSGAVIEPARPVPGSKFFQKPYSLEALGEACVQRRPT